MMGSVAVFLTIYALRQTSTIAVDGGELLLVGVPGALALIGVVTTAIVNFFSNHDRAEALRNEHNLKALAELNDALQDEIHRRSQVEKDLRDALKTQEMEIQRLRREQYEQSLREETCQRQLAKIEWELRQLRSELPSEDG